MPNTESNQMNIYIYHRSNSLYLINLYYNHAHFIRSRYVNVNNINDKDDNDDIDDYNKAYDKEPKLIA